MTDGKRARVLHLVDSAGIYGAERVILNLSREMARHDEFCPVVGALVGDADEPNALVAAAAAAGIEAHKLVVRNPWLPLDLPRFGARVRELEIDIVHSHGYKPSVFAFATRKISRARVTATCHLWFVGADAPFRMRLMIAIEQFLYRFFPVIVAVSDEIAAVLRDSGVHPDRIRVVPNGVAVETRGSDADRDGEMSRAGPKRRVVNTARLTQQKDQRSIIAAATLLRGSHPDVEFVIAGDGELRSELEAQIRAEGLEKTVFLVGFQEDIVALLKRADVFALPSLAEGMPMSLLEAVATGVPVVATNVGDVGKLIRHGDTGVIVPPGDPAALATALASMLDDPGATRAMASRAFTEMEKTYSSRSMFDAYARIYRALSPEYGEARAASRSSER